MLLRTDATENFEMVFWIFISGKTGDVPTFSPFSWMCFNPISPKISHFINDVAESHKRSKNYHFEKMWGHKYNDNPTHVLVHCVKSIKAYNVKSSSTLFTDNIQWNFRDFFLLYKIYQLVWLQLDYRMLGLWETRLFRPMCHTT